MHQRLKYGEVIWLVSWRNKLMGMTQDERWNIRYQEVKRFIETNKRNPSKYNPEERLMVHFLKRGRKMLSMM